jgi:GGDEF domain-containing protein/protein-L-isoaspartate O-methyltransferase
MPNNLSNDGMTDAQALSSIENFQAPAPAAAAPAPISGGNIIEGAKLLGRSAIAIPQAVSQAAAGAVGSLTDAAGFQAQDNPVYRGLDAFNKDAEFSRHDPSSPLAADSAWRAANPIKATIGDAAESIAPIAAITAATGGAAAVALPVTYGLKKQEEGTQLGMQNNPGMTEPEARLRATPGGVVEGGMFAAMGAAGGLGKAGLAKAAPGFFGDTVAADVPGIVNYGAKKAFRDALSTTLTDTPFMVGQGLAVGATDKATGTTPDAHPIDDAFSGQNLLTSAGTAAMFGLLHAHGASRQLAGVRDALSDPEAPVEAREKAAQYVYDNLKAADPAAADNWGLNAKIAIHGLPDGPYWNAVEPHPIPLDNRYLNDPFYLWGKEDPQQQAIGYTPGPDSGAQPEPGAPPATPPGAPVYDAEWSDATPQPLLTDGSGGAPEPANPLSPIAAAEPTAPAAPAGPLGKALMSGGIVAPEVHNLDSAPAASALVASPTTAVPGPLSRAIAPISSLADMVKASRAGRTSTMPGDAGPQGELNDLPQVRQEAGATQEVPSMRNGDVAPISAVDEAAHESAFSPLNGLAAPTQGQIEAGNYQKGHINVQGLNISIENPAGSTRSGTDQDGKPWSVDMAHHYGYIKGTVGVDKDHIDTFVKEGTDHQAANDKVFVVDQIDHKTGQMDEHKVMIGFDTVAAAREGYLANYDKTGEQRIGALTETTMPEFKTWLKEGDTKSAFGEVVERKTEGHPAPAEVPETAVAETEAPAVETKAGETGTVSPKTDAAIRGVLQTLQNPKSGSAAKIANLSTKYGKETVNDLVRSGHISFPGKGVAEITKKGQQYLVDHPEALNPIALKKLEALSKKRKRNAKEEAMYQTLNDRHEKTKDQVAAVAENAVPATDRRQDPTLRKKIADMSPAEVQKELLTNHVTGLPNKRAYDEAPLSGYHAAIDADSLKWINDNMGHENGDELLKAVGQAIADETDKGYHLSGDEFAIIGNDEAHVNGIMAKVSERLKDAELVYTAPDGTVYRKKGLEVTHGTGTTFAEADTALRARKIEREKAGERAARGDQPKGVAIETPEGRKADGEVAEKVETSPEKRTGTETRTDTLDVARKDDTASPPTGSSSDSIIASVDTGVKAKPTPEEELYALAKASYTHVSPSPSRAAQAYRDGMVSATADLQSELSKLATTDEQKAIAITQVDLFKRGYLEKSRPILNAISNQVSKMVAGGSKFNENHGKRNERAQGAEQKANDEFQKWNAQVRGGAKDAVLDARTPEQVAADDQAGKDTIAKKIERRRAVEVSAVKKFMALKPGDTIDVGGNAPVEIAKKNRKSVETVGGAKYSINDLYQIDGKRIDEIMAGLDEERSRAVEAFKGAEKLEGEISGYVGEKVAKEIADKIDGELADQDGPARSEVVSSTGRGAVFYAEKQKELAKALSDIKDQADQPDSLIARQMEQRRAASNQKAMDAMDAADRQEAEDLAETLEKKVITPEQQSLIDEAVDSGDKEAILEAMSEVAATAKDKFKVVPGGEAVHADSPSLNEIATIADHAKVSKAIRSGDITPDQFKSSFASMVSNEDAIKAELNGMSKAEALKLAGSMTAERYKNEKKADAIRAVYDSMLAEFALNRGITYQGFGKDAYTNALQKMVDGTTAGDISGYAKEVEEARSATMKRREAGMKALSNPETLEEFQTFIKYKGEGKLTKDQRAAYDEAVASSNKDQKAADLEKKATVGQVKLGDETTFTMVEGKHGKTGEPLSIVQLGGPKLEGDAFKELAQKARQLGGNYVNNMQARIWKTTGGFQFKDQESAERFMQLRDGSVSVAGKVEAKQEEKKSAAADRLLELADSMEEKGNAVLNTDRLTNTAKRAREASGTEAAAAGQVAMAKTIRNLAQAIASGDATHLDGIRAATHVQTLSDLLNRAKQAKLDIDYPSYGEREQHKNRAATTDDVALVKYPYPTPHIDHLRTIASSLKDIKGRKMDAAWLNKRINEQGADSVVPFTDAQDVERLAGILARVKESVPGNSLRSAMENTAERMVNYNRLQKMGITDLPSLRAALREFIQYKENRSAPDKAKELERALVGNKGVGLDFFPTPPKVAADMVKRADIKPGMKVLEPGGGTGNIADKMKDAGADVDVAEISQSLRDVLEAKEHNLVARDFMDYEPGPIYDRVLMNPPFSADIDHVQHAFDLLKPGGKLVAIVGEGSFGGQKKHTEFQQWLDDKGASVEKLPSGTFTDRTQLKTTGAGARMVEMEKGGDVAEQHPIETLTETGLLREYGDRWQYKPHPEARWLTSNSKDGAIEQASNAYDSLPENERLTTTQRGEQADAKRDAELEKRYGKESTPDLEKRLAGLDGEIASLQKAGSREFNGNGGRRTSAAVSNEGARAAGQEKMDLARYLGTRAETETARTAYEDVRMPDTPAEVVTEAVKTAKGEGTALKEQKKYLLANIEDAVKDASSHSRGTELEAAKKGIEADRKKTEDHTAYKLRVQTAEAAYANVTDALAKDYGYVTIHVPDDGTFKVLNTKESLQQFKSNVERLFPTDSKGGAKGYGNAPKPTNVKAEGLEGATTFQTTSGVWHTTPQMLVKGEPQIKPKVTKDGSDYGSRFLKETPEGNQNSVDRVRPPMRSTTPVDKVEFVAGAKDGATDNGDFTSISDKPIKVSKSNGEEAFARLTAIGKPDVYLGQNHYLYAKEHYPDAEVRISDSLGPVAFVQDGQVVAAVMPMNPERMGLQPDGIRYSKVVKIIQGDSGLGDASVTPAKSFPDIRSILDDQNAKQVSVKGGNSDVLRRLAGVFGKRIIFYAPEGSEGEVAAADHGRPEDGQDLSPMQHNGFVVGGRPSTIFLNAEANNHLLFILGHELQHLLHNEDPDLWREMGRDINPLVRGWVAAREEYSKVYKTDDSLYLSQEFLGDVVGEHFLDGKFWGDLADQDKNLFQKVANKAISLINKALRLVVDSPVATTYISDLTQSRAVISRVMGEYAQNARIGAYADAYDKDYTEKRFALSPTSTGNGMLGLQRIYEKLAGTKTAQEAASYLEVGARKVYEGAKSYSDFTKGMKDWLKDLWERFKGGMLKLYQFAKSKLQEERGSFSWKGVDGGDEASADNTAWDAMLKKARDTQAKVDAFTDKSRFAKDDVKPAFKAAADGMKTSYDGLHRAVHPAGRSKEAAEASRILTEGIGKTAHSKDQLIAKLDEAASKESKNVTFTARMLDLMQTSSTLADKVVSSMSEADQIDAIMRAQHGQSQATPEVQRIMDVLQSMLAGKAAVVQALDTGALENLMENYFPQITVPGEDTSEDAIKKINTELSKRPLEGSKGFTKHRVFDDVEAVYSAGYKLVTTNPIDLTFLKMDEMDKYINAHTALQAMEKSDSELAHLILPGDKVPKGYTEINGPYGIVTKKTGTASDEEIKDAYQKVAKLEGVRKSLTQKLADAQEEFGDFSPEHQEASDNLDTVADMLKNAKSEYAQATGKVNWRYVVREDVAQVINNYTSQSLYNNRYVGKIYTGYMKAANLLNRFQLGVFSAFHGGFMTMENIISHASIGMKALSRGDFETAMEYLGTAPSAVLAPWRLGDQIMQSWMGGKGSDEMARIISWLELAGARKLLDTRFQSNSTKEMFQAWANGNKVGAVLRGIPSIVEQSARPITEWFVPRCKFAAFGEMANDWFSRNPDATHADLAEAMQKIWNRVDSRMGQVNYDRLFSHNVMKNLVQALIRAPGWTGGTILEVGGGLKDLAGYLKNASLGKPGELSDRGAYVLSLALTHAVVNGILTTLFTGQPPQDLKDLLAFRTGNLDEHGNPERFMLPDYAKDMYAYIEAPGSTLAHKTHPALSLIGDAIHNKTYYGQEIRHPGDSLFAQLAQMAGFVADAFVPFWMKGAQKEIERGGSPLTIGLPQIGVMPAPADMNKTKAEKMARDLMVDRMPQGSKTQEESDRSQLVGKLTNEIRKNSPDARADIQKAVYDGKITRIQAHNVLMNSHFTPLQVAFKHLGYEEAQKVMEVATPDEKQKLQGLLIAKQRGFNKTHPKQNAE